MLPFGLSAYDLSQIHVEKLSNGLTLLFLEDHSVPLVSTQVLYKVGARNECDGTTGLAHFCEHMSFRATKNFPDTQVVSRIYAVGGEWHAYTWLDQTTYFETVPREDLDLTLRIQADRMGSALIKADEVEAERGAVLTELHSYENDPASILNDAVMQVVFLEHPYRNNTIGWKSDVEKLTHEDIANFYHRYYRPSNAVLAIAGDIDWQQTHDLTQKYFGSIPSGEPTSDSRAVEPPQTGERRISVPGTGTSNYYQISYLAPSVTDPDYATFLLLQAVLSGSPGVNFKQKEDAQIAVPGSRLEGVTDDIGTFFIPTEDPYVFNIGGSSEPLQDKTEIETTIESRIQTIRQEPVPAAELEAARKQVLRALLFDIESTEDAVHQMAYFEGIGGLSVLQTLSSRVGAVTAGDVQRAARRFLQPYQRTIGWYVVGPKQEAPPEAPVTAAPAPAAAPAATVATALRSISTPPQTARLKNGVVLITRAIRHTPTGFLRILIPTNTVEDTAEMTSDDPVWGYTSINLPFEASGVEQTIARAANMGWSPAEPPTSPSDDPETRLDQEIAKLLQPAGSKTAISPAIVSVAGDIDTQKVMTLLKSAFAKTRTTKLPVAAAVKMDKASQTVSLPGKPQSEFGYVLAAPTPGNPSSDAYRILLYILAHDYEGRLGKELIGRTGLIYYIGTRYHSNGPAAWISIDFGVDPDKLAKTQDAFNAIVKDLTVHPPTSQEVEEAKQYLIGRRTTANQSNEELSALYAREWIEQGRLLTDAEFERRVRSVTLDQVLKIVPAFQSGSTVVVDTH